MTKKIRALFIFEILGKPPEHIKDALEDLIDKFGKNQGIEVINKKVHEPKPVEDEKVKGFFTTFAEVEANIDSMNLLFGIIFNLLPSHVEILEPDEFRIDNFQLGSFLTDLTIKMHRYDEISKALMFENNNLLCKIKEMQEIGNQNINVIEKKDENKKIVRKKKK